MVRVGGVVPPQDHDALKTAGAEAIFPPGTVIAEAAEIVPVGVIPPDEVVTPAVLVDHLVQRAQVNGR